jgi:DnaB helicase-like protein/AAA domain-containing protein
MNNGEFPNSVDAEKGLLGSILLAPERVLDAQTWLRPEDFYKADHQTIFEQILEMRSLGKPIDQISLTQHLEDRKLLVKLGGAAYVTELFTFVPTASNAAYYAEIIQEKSLARRTIAFANELISDANDPAKQKELRSLVETALDEISKLPIRNGQLPPMIWAEELCKTPPPTPPEIIKGLLHQGSKMALGGGSKSFKTWVLLELSICIAMGRDWLGFPTTQGKVLYVNFELPAFAMEARISEICSAIGAEFPEKTMAVRNLRGYSTDAATILPEIARDAKRHGFVFMVLDPMYKLLGNRDENSSRDMTDLMNRVERLTLETGAGVAFGGHYSKGNQSGKEAMDRISGSGVFARDPDSIVTMTKHETDNAFSVEMTLRNFPPQEPFVVRRQHPLMVIDGKLDPAKLKQVGGRKPKHHPDDLLKVLSGSMTDSDWKIEAEERGISRSTYYELKNQLVNAGKVFQSAIDQKWGRKA